MTYLDKIKQAQNGAEFMRIYNHFHGGCMQNGAKAKEVWKSHCLSDEYRGMDGCKRCREEFWDKEYKEEE